MFDDDGLEEGGSMPWHKPQAEDNQNLSRAAATPASSKGQQGVPRRHTHLILNS